MVCLLSLAMHKAQFCVCSTGLGEVKRSKGDYHDSILNRKAWVHLLLHAPCRAEVLSSDTSQPSSLSSTVLCRATLGRHCWCTASRVMACGVDIDCR